MYEWLSHELLDLHAWMRAWQLSDKEQLTGFTQSAPHGQIARIYRKRMQGMQSYTQIERFKQLLGPLITRQLASLAVRGVTKGT